MATTRTWNRLKDYEDIQFDFLKELPELLSTDRK